MAELHGELNRPLVEPIVSCMDSPYVDQNAATIVAYISLVQLNPDTDVILTTQYATAACSIYRYRKGTDAGFVVQVNAAAMTEVNGYATYAYTFPNATWQDGDKILYAISGVVVTLLGHTYTLPTIFRYGTMASIGTDLRTEQSESGPVEEGAYEMFQISIFDLDLGAVPSTSIDIVTTMTAVLEKSTGGADFSIVGITQPVFAKDDGRVYCSYPFLAPQWAEGDLYRLVVKGITATIDTGTVYIPAMVWSNLILLAGVEETEAGLAYSGTCTADGTDTTAICLTLAGHGTDFFATKYYIQIISNISGVGASPEPKVRKITAYNTTTGAFTFGTVTDAPVTGDKIMIFHESLAAIGRNGADSDYASGNVVGDIDGDIQERIEAIQAGMQIVAAAGTGFEADGSGITLGKAVAGNFSVDWATGASAQRSLLDMPYVKPDLQCMDSPQVDQNAATIVSRISLINLRPDSDVIQVAEYAGAAISIYRYRKGTDAGFVAQVTTQAMTEVAGFATYAYTFPNATWQNGDKVMYEVSGLVVTIAGQAFTMPSVFAYGEVGVAPAIAVDLVIDTTSRVDQAAASTFASMSIHNASDDNGLVLTAEVITPPTVTFYRTRQGYDATYSLVVALPMTAADGWCYLNYNFPSLSWQKGDGVHIVVASGIVTIGGRTYYIPSMSKAFELGVEATVLPNMDTQTVDNFESYADTAALTGVWADTTTFSTITLEIGAGALQGTRSMKVVVAAGGVGEAYRALAQYAFGKPYPRGNGRMFSFIAKASAGTPIIGLTIRQAANRLNNFITYNVTLSTTSTLYRVDMSRVADTTGGVFDSNTCDEVAFTSLDISTDFYFEDLKFAFQESVREFLGTRLTTGYDSSAVTANNDGSVMEREEGLLVELETATLDVGDGSVADNVRLGLLARYIADNLVLLTASGLAYKAAVTTATDATHFKATVLIGYGNSYFKNWSTYVLWDKDAAGAAPQNEMRANVAFTSADGTVEHAAFSVDLTVLDIVLMIHPSIAALINTTYGLSAHHTEMQTLTLATGGGSIATTVRAGMLIRWIGDAINDAAFGLDAIHTDVTTINTETEATSLVVGAGSIALNTRTGMLIRWIGDAINDATIGLSAIHADVAAITTEVETTTLDIGDGSAADNVRAGLLTRYIADSVSTGTLSLTESTGGSKVLVSDVAITQAAGFWKGALLLITSGANLGQARPVVASAVGSVTVFPGFDANVAISDTAQLISAWRPNVWNQQPAAVINAVACTDDAETEIFGSKFDVLAGGLAYSYMINSLRLKISADPVANVVTVRLYELINGAYQIADTFTIDTTNYGTYFSLLEMFAVNCLAGDSFKVTVQTTTGATHYTVSGQYQYALARTV